MAISFVKQILAGKTLGRALFNEQVALHTSGLTGRVLDLGGGKGGYLQFLPKNLEVFSTDVSGTGAGQVDFNKPLPFQDHSFDHVFLFNALYIAENPTALMQEIKRVLRPGGSLLVASPYLQNEMREPHDYRRFTSEGLQKLFQEAGLHATLTSYGERFSVAANLLHSFWLLSLIRLPVYALAKLFDRMIPTRVRTAHPAPIGYFCVATKQ